MLKLDKVNTYYGESHVLFDISLEVNPGEIVALVGRNGVGKTTTMMTIMGLVQPKSGSITFKGKQIAGKAPHQIAMAGLGFVPEERWIFPNLTVHQNLLMGIKPGHMNKPVDDGWSIERAYDSFPRLAERRNQKGGVLSGGEMQMLTIVRSLMGNPDLILIDEPTEGLAPIIVERVNEVIHQINRAGTTVLLVEQKLNVCLDLAQRLYVLSKGDIKWTGTPGELESRQDIRKEFLEV
ncbi:ABC transporter ATP-binding protein [Desulfoferula mesophila]|uniref:ABC transporter ATP-binding protein n=1 Tax=Desulfoferula mesophila TaxID=3058419 RepID=A0AAU9ECT9_9BACT|nr:ABC transporter ATP-binding protein [Desulfoferula mesophilus]